jgi:hypothetical protein
MLVKVDCRKLNDDVLHQNCRQAAGIRYAAFQGLKNRSSSESVSAMTPCSTEAGLAAVSLVPVFRSLPSAEGDKAIAILRLELGSGSASKLMGSTAEPEASLLSRRFSFKGAGLVSSSVKTT